MIVFRITMNAIPEKYKELSQTLVSMIEPTEKEEGCLSYAVLCDIEGKNFFNLISEWKTRRHLDHHMKSDRFGVLLGSKPLLHGPLKIQINTVSKSEEMEAVHCLRSIP